MKIGINALGLGSGSAGGLEIYFLNLVKNLSQRDGGHDYHVFANHKKIREMLMPFMNSAMQLHYVSRAYTYIVGGLVLLLARPRLVVDMAKKMIMGRPVSVDATGTFGNVINFDRFRLDVIHFPFSTIDPSFFNISVPIVLTIPDIQHEYYPDFFDRETLAWRKQFYEASAKRADVIITISEASKNSITRKFGISAEKIMVTHLSCSDSFGKIHDANVLASVKKKYSLPDEFLFYPAGTWPHKNHKKLIEALSILRDKYGFEKKLVMTGIPQNNHDKVLEAIGKLNLTDKTIFLNFIPSEDLPAIYNLARMLVFPSLFEGFGIPLVEAMQVGLPIACSDRTSVPEVVGNAGLYFDPENPHEMAKQIHRLWQDDELRQDLITKGFERRKLFSEEQMTKKTIEAYELAAKYES